MAYTVQYLWRTWMGPKKDNTSLTSLNADVPDI